MQVGDPKKTAALGVVAIAAIGFLVYRLVPEGSSRPAKSPATASAAPTVESGARELVPVAIVGDPFSHPMLARNTAGPTSPHTTNPQPGKSSPTDTGTQPALVGPMQVLPLPQAGGSQTQPFSGPAPSQPAPPTTFKVTVKGILCADETIAYLSLDGGSSAAFRVGDKVADNIRIKVITTDTVVFQRETKTQAVKVGQQAEL